MTGLERYFKEEWEGQNAFIFMKASLSRCLLEFHTY